jgi:hypothetical protein
MFVDFLIKKYTFHCFWYYSTLDIYSFTGGIAVVGNPRYARANNAEMPKEMFYEDEENSYIDFMDFNGLYTSTMTSARLPAYGFRFLERNEIDRINFAEIPPDNDHGYILEVDLSYPPELHDNHDGMIFIFPLLF